jgi:hypothetical protein
MKKKIPCHVSGNMIRFICYFEENICAKLQRKIKEIEP